MPRKQNDKDRPSAAESPRREASGERGAGEKVETLPGPKPARPSALLDIRVIYCATTWNSSGN